MGDRLALLLADKKGDDAILYQGVDLGAIAVLDVRGGGSEKTPKARQ
jgi:hypothetical protein